MEAVQLGNKTAGNGQCFSSDGYPVAPQRAFSRFIDLIFVYLRAAEPLNAIMESTCSP
jgi:hypothetical protein